MSEAITKNHAVGGVVATPHYLATQIGMDVLQMGGNAFDAAVAVSLAIGVTQPYHSGIGGGCSCTFLTADGEHGHIQGRGPAPAKLDRALFLDDSGMPDYDRVKAGGLAIVIPALVAGMQRLHEQFGRLDWAPLCLASVPVARDGFPADFMFAKVSQTENSIDKLSRFAQNTPMATSVTEGQHFAQPNLAKTLQTLAADPRALYSGDLAKTIVDHVQQVGGVLSEHDMASYVPPQTALHEGTYRGWRILGPSVPLIGAVQTLLALQILDHFELGRLVHGSPQHLHLVAEAIKSTYIARAELASEDEIPSLATPQMAADLAARIKMESTLDFPQLEAAGDEGAGSVVEAMPNDAESCTSHFCIADGDGNIVSQTQTVRNHFGSGVVEPTSGILLNDTVGDFSMRPGEVTTQGIRYNGSYNLVAAGAEPASSQSPMIAIHAESGDMIAAGAAGGPMIVSATVQALVNMIDFGMSARESNHAVRIHCHGPTLVLEPTLARSHVATELAALGHSLETRESIAVMQAIRRAGNVWDGAADPRAPGAVAVADGGSVRVYGFGGA